MRNIADLPYLEWVDDAGVSQRLYPDVQENESTTLSSVITTHPIEVGADAADHIRPENETVDVTWVFSNSPVRGDLSPQFVGSERYQLLTYPQGPGGPPIFTPGGVVNAFAAPLSSQAPLPESIRVFGFDADVQRVSEAFDTIQDLRDAKRIVTIATSVAVFESMVITQAVVTKDLAIGDGVRIALTVQRITFVESDVALALPIEPRGQAKKKAAAEGTKPKEMSKAELSSTAKAFLNSTGLTSFGSGL